MNRKSLQGRLSRRSAIKALFGGALIVGFHATRLSAIAQPGCTWAALAGARSLYTDHLVKL
jgi:hypothetical protein